MVSSKVKSMKTTGISILEDPRPPKNIKDFKMSSGAERTKTESSRMSSKASMAGPLRSSAATYATARSAPKNGVNRSTANATNAENVLGKCDRPVKNQEVKVGTGRKPLADVSNGNKDEGHQSRYLLSSDSKHMKDKVDSRNLLQGRMVSGKNFSAQRNSLIKSVSVANVSSRRPIGGNLKNSEGITRQQNISVGSSMRRKGPSEVNSLGTRRGIHLKNGSKQIKNQGVKLLRPRLSLANQKAMHGNTSSKKIFGVTGNIIQMNFRLNRLSLTKCSSDLEDSCTLNPSKPREADASTKSECHDNVSDVSEGPSIPKAHFDGGNCDSDSVKTVIIKKKHSRRRSYTLSLMARSEVVGKCADFVNKDDQPNIDDNSNPLEVAEYVDDIYQHYWTTEVENPKLANYMAIQSEITTRMRGVLINWLIEVHLKFELMQETLFLMVELLDRVLAVVPIKKHDFQMAGLTALLLASKYEDNWHPKIKDLISISSNLYTRNQMLAMEKLILKTLKFRLNMPTPYIFMLRFLKAAQSDRKLEHLAFYLLELCLLEFEALKYKSSLLAASAIYIARSTLDITPAWSGLLRKHARYEEPQLRGCANMILRFQRAASSKPSKTTYEKFLNADHSCVAAISAIDDLPL